MQLYLQENTIPNVCFIDVAPSRFTRLLNYLNGKRIFVYTWYFSYKSWHKQVYEKAKELLISEHYDVIHYLNPIGYREPGYLWKLDAPYMWGPIAGTSNYPFSLFGVLHRGEKIKFGFRTWANKIQFKHMKRLKKALASTDVLLTCTTEDQEKFKSVYRKDSVYLPEFSLSSEPVVNQDKFKNIHQKIQLIFVGTLDGRKAVIIQLMALCKVTYKSKIHLDIVGDGIHRGELEKFVDDNGLRDMVTFHGKIPRSQVAEKFDNAHLNMITSLGEANTVTIFESISRGVPSLSVDHCGMHDTVTPEVGYPIPIKSLHQVVSDIASTLDYIVENPTDLIEKSQAVVRQSKNYQWSDRIALFEKCYDECVNSYNLRKKVINHAL